MKLRAKFTLLQLIIAAGFVASMVLVMLRFGQAYNLKELEFKAVNAMTELRNLEKKTSLFGGRSGYLDQLWQDWSSSYRRFDDQYTGMLKSPYHRLLGRNAISGRDARSEAWAKIKRSEIEPMIRDFEEILAGPLPAMAADNGIRTTGKLIDRRIGFDSTEANRFGEIDSRFSDLRDSLVSRISIPTESFIDDLRQRTTQFFRTVYITAIIIVLVLQAGGALLMFRFSRNLSRHIIDLERNLAAVANGNFDISLNIESGDEFEDISRHFNTLIRDLRNRLESMKDMMRDIGSSVGEDIDMGELENFMLELAIDNTGADAGLLMSVNDGMLTLNKVQGYFPPPMALPPMVAGKREYVVEWFASHRIPPGEGMLGQVLGTGDPRFIRNNFEGDLPDNADIESDLYIHSAIFIPLSVSGTVLGVLALALTGQDRMFTDLDYSYMRSYGEFIALTMDNMFKYLELVKNRQINREIEVAASIQKRLLPEKIPSLRGAEVAAFSEAAKGVGGDYYDVFDLGEGKTALVICDVAGKGVPASLLMIMIRTVIRTISTPEKRSDRIMTELNRTITGRIHADRFATVSLLIFDSRKGVISYSNGAHHPLYILRGESRHFRMFDTDGLPMGIDINASFGHKRIRVRPKDYLVLFTDGLPEARNTEGNELGTDRLLRFVARHADKAPNELVRRVKDYIDDFTSGERQHDDQTFVALRVG